MARPTNSFSARRAKPSPVAASAMTAAQWEAVMAEDRVVCVLAGAGAGKTRVLTMRVARRCGDSSATPEHTLVCTFSRKAAEELWDRLRSMSVFGVTAGTIHRVALRVVRDWRDHRRLPAPTVLGDRRRILESLFPEQHAGRLAVQQADTEIGWAKAHMAGAEDYESLARRSGRVIRLPVPLVAESFAAYETERQRLGLLDLDDLLLEGARILQDDPGFAEALRWRFRHLYVDELQDVNPAQFHLVRLLCGKDPDLFCVGDPNQSIYGWNGADPDLLAQLPDVFPGTRVIRLDDNHRSSPAIVRLAAAALEVIDVPNSTRPDGPVPVIVGHETDRDEAEWLAKEAWLSHPPGRRWSAIAVLARTNAQLRTVAQALDRQKVPYSFASGELGPASDLGTPSEDGTMLDSDLGGIPDAEEHRDGVTLSTFHRAKGLQWQCVFVIGLSEGLVPIGSARAPAALAEEQRLLYVAMTRAEEELWCSWAVEREGGGVRRKPSRWLGAIEREKAAFQVEQGPADPGSVLTHLSHIRSIMSRPAEAAPGDPPVRRNRRAPR